MATLTTVRLTKGDSPNWGFRLQGGKDFGTPLVIQKVNGGSPAERAGLIAGDSVIKINNVDVYNLLHKEAQDVIVRAGTSFEMVIQRGGSTWKPSVVPTGTYAKPSPSINNVSPITKTSLAASRGENIGAIGTGHNLSAKPFAPQVNGAVNGGPKLVNKQYNTPLKLYSEDAIAETISAQSEVLSTGALGVNFKKNEKNYDATNSAVYRMLKEAENDADAPSNEPEPDAGIVTAPNRGMAGLRHVEAPTNRPAPANPQLPPGQNICAECERLIVGVFVRIKDKNLHVECFKCSTCGSSLKNVGYYNINNKLYCDIHAKAAAIAINNPAAIPVTIPTSGKAPVSAISAALSGHSLPSPSPLSPKTSGFAPSYPPAEEQKEAEPVADDLSSAPSLPNINSAPSYESNIKPSSNSSLYNSSAPLSFSKYINKSSNIGGPKPFSSVSAPLSPGGTLPRAAPLSPQSNYTKAPLSPSVPSYGSYSPSSTAEHVSEMYQTNIPETITDLDEVCQQLPPPPPPPTVPVYSQINITIPHQNFQSSSQLDSIGSSPKSDYSSHSSTSSGKHHNQMDMAKDKIITEINKGLMPKLKRVSISETQSPRLNYIVSNVNTVIENNVKRVKSELVIPINNSTPKGNISNKIATESTLPDHLTYANQSTSHEEFTEKIYKRFSTDEIETKPNDFDSKAAPICWKCNLEITRGPFITALGKIWCPQHFVCATPSCRRPLQDLGFVEERGQLYCEYCFEQYLAPPCSKCNGKIKGDCLKAIGKNFHPECFNCVYCGKLFGNNPFFLEDGNPYCDADWNELFTTKCFACGFPVEAGDRWVEALNNNYHSQCFNCTMCKKNLEGQSFFAKGGRPFCKNHAR